MLVPTRFIYLKPTHWIACLLTVAIHLSILWILQMTQGRVFHAAQPVSTDSMQLIWLKPYLPQADTTSAASNKSARPINPARMSRNPLTTPNALPQLVATPSQSDVPAAVPPLDVGQILHNVGSDIAKSDQAQPKERPDHNETTTITLQSRLEKGFAAAAAAVRPKWNEPARMEEITSGAQADAGVRVYKITTFAGSYCVTYLPDRPKTKGPCPIEF
jgi:hypothetical protein